MTSNPPAPVTPHNREAEEAVIGAVLINPQMFYDLESSLGAEDFYIVRHRWIWESFERLRKAKSPIDFLTVTTDLQTAGKLVEIGGSAFLTSLLNQVPTSLHAPAYAEIVLAESTRRAHIDYANRIATVALDPKIKSQDIDAKFRAISLPVARGQCNVEYAEDVGLRVMTLLDDPSPKAIPCHVLMQDATGKDFIYGVPTMTQELGGLPYGDSIILAAPTQTGKTTLAYQLAEVAAFQNLKAHYVSTESTGVGLLTKRAMGNLGMSMKTLRTGMITDLQRQEAKDEINRLMGLYNGYLTFDDKSHDVDSVLRNVARAKPSLLVVDHLGELRYKGDNKTIGIEENFTEIRRYCHAEGIAFLCVHMIDIDVTTRPQLSDLRWAKGGLSEKCDIALMMYRPDLADCRDGDENTIQAAVQIRRMPVQVEIWERKDRGGPVDLLIDSVFDLHYQFFRSPAMQMQGQQIAFTV